MMWNVGDKNVNFEGHMTGYVPANTEVRFMEKSNFMNHNGSEKPFLSESPGKGQNFFSMKNEVLYAVPSFYRGKFGDNLQNMSNEMVSENQLHIANTQHGAFGDKDVPSAEMNMMFSQSVDRQFHDVNNCSTGLQTKGMDAQKLGLKFSQSTLYQAGSSQECYTSIVKHPQLPNLQQLMYGLSSQGDVGKFLSYGTEAALSREKVVMNIISAGTVNPNSEGFPPLNSVHLPPVSESHGTSFGSVKSTEFFQPGICGTDLGNTEAKLECRNSSGHAGCVGATVEAVKDCFNTDMPGLPKALFNKVVSLQTFDVTKRSQAISQYHSKSDGQSHIQLSNAGASFNPNNQEKNEAETLEKPSDSKTTKMVSTRVTESSNEAHDSKMMNDSDDGNDKNFLKKEILEKTGMPISRIATVCEKQPEKDLSSKLPPMKFAPKNTDQLWDGTLQLNTSTVVSAVAVFKSGEKVSEVNWSKYVEVKGKVRLEAFEKFVQELPRSRTRALMVVSIHWKVGTSQTGLQGMREVARSYKEGQRVGFALLCQGIDLYVCPRSDAIITILAKYGFFKGIAAVEDDQDSLIGCVIWRRNHSSSDLNSKKMGKNELPSLEQPVTSKKMDKTELPSLEQPVDSLQSGITNKTDKRTLINRTVSSGSDQVTAGSRVLDGTSNSVVNPLVPGKEISSDMKNMAIRSPNVSFSDTTNNDIVHHALAPSSTQNSSITSQLPISAQHTGTRADISSTMPLHISSFIPQPSLSIQKMDTPALNARKFTTPGTTTFGHTELKNKLHADISESSPHLMFGASQKLQGNKQRSTDNDDDDDLPEFDFGNAYGIPRPRKNDKFPPSISNPCLFEFPFRREQLPVEISKVPIAVKPPHFLLNDGAHGHAQSYIVLMQNTSQNVFKELGAAIHGPKLSAKTIESSSLLGSPVTDAKLENPVSKSFFVSETAETMGSSNNSVASEKQTSAGQAAKSSFVQKSPIWDDDEDDMPEWNPPPNLDNRQLPPMPVLLPQLLQPTPSSTSRLTATSSPFHLPPAIPHSWSPNPLPIQPPFPSHYDQNISRQHQSGILPRRPLDGNHKAPVETRPAAARFGRTGKRVSSESYPSQSKRQRRVTGWDVKPGEVKLDTQHGQNRRYR